MECASSVDWPLILSLRELQEPGEPDVIAELIQTFLADSAARMARLRAAVLAGDARSIVREAHTFKGSAGVFAADSLRADAERLEAEANVHLDDLAPFVERLSESLGSVQRALQDGPPSS